MAYSAVFDLYSLMSGVRILYFSATKFGGCSYFKKRIVIDDFEIIDKFLKHLNHWDILNHDPSEIEPVYIPELTYVEDSDYNNSGTQIPVFDTF